MTFTRSWILFFLPLLPAIEIFLYYKLRANSLNLPPASFLYARETWRTLLLRWMRFFPSIALAILLVALAGPRQIEMNRQILPSGIQIMVALDVSGSMAAEDFQPLNRLEVAKTMLKNFIQGRSSDRIGLILFAGRSITRAPLTLQHSSLTRTLETTMMGTLPEGTAIGTAIMSGVNRLARSGTQVSSSSGARILILITDGRNNAGEIHPLDALAIAAEQKIKIYTIGVGGYGNVPFPFITPDGKKTYRYEKADLDENLLREIAQRTGGKYFRAADPDSLRNLFEQINLLEKSEPQVVETRTLQMKASVFAVPALAILFFYILLTIFIVRLP